MSKIPRQWIDQLLQRTDVVSVIERRIKLTRRGSNLMACCPFHQEKTPSFAVSPQKQFFHCFGCGEAGNAIDFVMRYDSLSFIEALEYLAESAGMAMPPGKGPNLDADLQSGYDMMQECLHFYRTRLSEADAAAEYALVRGLDDEVMQRYQIGYAPDEWDRIVTDLATSTARNDALIKSGMLAKSEKGRVYDRFRNRLMFPIYNRRGKVCAFGGRAIGVEDNPKYLNSPETPWFRKTNELYGLYQLQREERNPPWILVTEGYMDVISLAQFGISKAVATMGTAVTESHLQQLFRITNRVVLCFDGDTAGAHAAERAFRNILPMMRDDYRLSVLVLPAGEDPDARVRAIGAEAFVHDVENRALDFTQYFISLLSRQFDTSKADDLPATFAFARDLISRATSAAWTTALIKALAEHAQLSMEEAHHALQLRLPAPKRRSTNAMADQRHKSHAQRLMQLLLHFPQAVAALKTSLPTGDSVAGINIARDLIARATEDPDIHGGALLEHWRDQEVYPLLVRLFSQDPLLKSADEAAREIDGCIDGLCHQIQRQDRGKMEQLVKQKGFSALDEGQKKRFLELLREDKGTS